MPSWARFFPRPTRNMAQKARKKTRARTKSQKRLRGSPLARDTIPRRILGYEVRRLILKFGLSREVAAVVVDDAASQMSRLMVGHYREFSADRLVRMLLRLGSDVTIVIQHPPKLGRRGRVRVKVN
jgi:predicted XRE-type DNA-binding protein